MRTEKPSGGTPAGDVGTVIAAHAALDGSSTLPWHRRLFPFLGPVFIAAVAYIDPGNFATNIQGDRSLVTLSCG